MKKCLFGFPVFLLCLIYSSNILHGQITWDGDGASQFWHDPANWSTNTIPTASDSVVIDVADTVYLGSTSAARGLYLGGSTTLVKNADLNLTTGLTIDTDATFVWASHNLDWPTLVNNGSIHIYASSIRYLNNGMQLANNGTIEFFDNSIIYTTAATIINEGDLNFHSGGRLTISSIGSRKIINTSNGTIFNDGANDSYIDLVIENHGRIESANGQIEFRDTVFNHNNSEWITATSGRIDFEGGFLWIDGEVTGTSHGNIVINENFTSTGGKVNVGVNGIEWSKGTFTNGDTLTNLNKFVIVAGNYKYIRNSAILLNKAVVHLDTNATLYVIAGKIINENTIHLDHNSDIVPSSSGVREIVNRSSGTISKIGGSGATQIDIPLHNYGTIHVQEGELTLSGDKYFHDGSNCLVAIGKQISLVSDPVFLDGELYGTIDGHFISSCDLYAYGANLNFAKNGWSWSRGDWHTKDTLSNAKVLNLIQGNYKYLRDTSVLINHSIMLLDTGSVLFFVEGHIINNDSLIMRQSADISESSSGGRILTNSSTGILLRKDGSDLSNINCQINNLGRIACQSGDLSLNGDKYFENGSEIDINSGSIIRLNTDPVYISGIVGGHIEGELLSRIDIYSNSGTLNFSENGWNWSIGSLRGGDTLTNTGAFHVVPGNYKYIRENTFIHNKNMFSLEDDGVLYMNEGAIINEDTMILRSNSNIYVSSTGVRNLYNKTNGLLMKGTASTGITQIQIPFYNSGTILIPESPQTIRTTSTFSNDGTAKLMGHGTFHIAGMTQDGMTAPGTSTGILNFTGSYIQSSMSTLHIELNGTTAGTEYDRVASSGAAQVAGDLVISLGFQPTIGDTFLIVTAPSFMTCDLPDTVTTCYNDEIQVFTTECTPTAIKLTFEGFQTAPPILCRNNFIYLDSNGEAIPVADSFISDEVIDCGYDEFFTTPSIVDCDAVGVFNIMLSATSLVSDTTTCIASLTVMDTISPNVYCQNSPTFYLDAAGQFTLSANQIDAGSSDACGIQSLVVDKTTFNCNDVGNHSVELMATDMNGNSATCSTTISIVDSTSPTVVVSDITVTLHPVNGTAGILPAMVDNGTTDNCGIASLALSKSSFNCADVGPVTIQLIATDINGNMNQAPVEVMVVDNTPPVVNASDITVTLHPTNGTASITPAMVDNGTTDNCGVATRTLSQTTFGCSDDNSVSVLFTAFDVNGNQNAESITVTVVKPGSQLAWVSESATGNGNGLSKTHAFQSLHEALTATGCIENVTEIRIVEGTYTPSTNLPDPRMATFEIDGTILVKGGYPTGAGPRNPMANPVVLSGDIGDIGQRSDNAYHVVTVPESASNVVLDGVIIRDGQATNTGHSDGGGLLANGKITLQNVQMEDCRADMEGGNLYISSTGHVLMISDVVLEQPINSPSSIFVEVGGQLDMDSSSEIK